MSISVSVFAVAAAVTSHSWELAAQHVLALWNRVRAPELAELMETLDLLALRATSGSVARFDLEQLRGADLIERGRLLSALRQRPELLAGFEPRSSEARPIAIGLCEVLGDLEPDPRISATLLALMRALPLRFEQYLDHGSLVDDCLDEREPFTARFCQLCLRHWSPEMGARGLFSERVSVLEHSTELAPEQRFALLDALLDLRAALFDDTADRAMCATHVADPFDQDALRVYADWLISRGDERGALILGTLADESSLVDGRYEVGERAFGPMRRWATSDLRRGWATQVRFCGDDRPSLGLDWARLEIGWRPGWAGVETLVEPPADLLTSTRLPALRQLSCLATTLDQALSSGAEFPRLTHLTLTLEQDGPDLRSLSARLERPGLPGLRVLRLSREADPRALTPWLAQPGRVAELFVWSSTSHAIAWARAATWLSRIRACASPLRRVIVTSSAGERWVFGHRGEGVDWQSVRLECWTTINVHVVERMQNVRALGAEEFCLVTRHAPASVVVGELRRRVRDCRIEIQPELPGFDGWEAPQ